MEIKSTSIANTASIKDKWVDDKWLFTPDQLLNTPSRKDKVTSEKELNYRQQAANLIQDMGQRLPVNQLTINTAIVYMHRFYMFHSFQAFSRFAMAPTALFLAAKVEEQPRKLEHVIRVCHSCLHPDKPHLDVHSDAYLKQVQQLVQHELIMLQTLGFDISIDHPHTHVVKCTQLVKASRDLSQMAYFMATNSLHLTTFCLKYKPTVVSAMCIHLSCKWSNYEIPLSSTGRAYWTYMDSTITEAMLENIIKEFLEILNLCPTRLRKLKNYKPSSRDGGMAAQSKDGQQTKSKNRGSQNAHTERLTTEIQPSQSMNIQNDQQKKPTASLSLAEYKTKRERELQSKHSNARQENSTEMDAQNAFSLHCTTQSSYKIQNHKQSVDRLKTESSYTGLKALLVQTETEKRPNIQPVSNLHVKPGKLSGVAQKLPSVSSVSAIQKYHMTDNSGQTMPRHTENNREKSNTQMVHGTYIRKGNDKPKRAIEASIHIAVSNSDGHSLDLSTVSNPIDRVERHIEEQMTTKQPFARESVISLEEDSSSLIEKHQIISSNLLQNECKSRQSISGAFSFDENKVHGEPSTLPQQRKSSYKLMYEQYKKNPEPFRDHLKNKAKNEPLTDEEKLILHKIKKEERHKRKQRYEKHKLNRSQPIESYRDIESDDVTPGGGSLTVRIKLPASVRAKITKSQPTSALAIGSSSGSGSEAMVSSPSGNILKHGRKRSHCPDQGGMSDPVSAKHVRKSEGHRQSHHSVNHESSKNRHNRSSSSGHAAHQKSQGQKIDNATFQQALVDAVSMVQSGHAAQSSSLDKVFPTVTVKRTQNHYENYATHPYVQKRHKSQKQLGFSSSKRMSTTVAESLFDAGLDGNSKQYESHSIVADLSSPETGEIRDNDDTSTLMKHSSE